MISPIEPIRSPIEPDKIRKWNDELLKGNQGLRGYIRIKNPLSR